MALNLTTLLPAKIGTSEIATKSNITTAIAAYDPAAAVNLGTTTINGGHITTGSITAGQIAANTITTNNIALGVGLVNGYVQSSDFTTVGGAGFRLKSNAAGTIADPTIYGAYIKGGTIYGTTVIASSFVYLTDAGLPTKPILTSSGLGVVYTPLDNITLSLGIYAYDAVTAPNNRRLSKLSGNIIDFGRTDLIKATNNGVITTFSLYIGSTLLSRFGSPGNYNVTSSIVNEYGVNWTLVEMNGITIKYYSTYDPNYGASASLYILNTPLEPLNGEGELKLIIGHDGITFNIPPFIIENF